MPCSTNEVIEELNRLLAEEVEASLRYLHLMSSLEQPEAKILALLQETFEETIEHAQILGKKIRDLGGLPRMNIQLQCPPRAVSTQEAIADALTVEEAALEGYQELAARIRADGNPSEILEFLDQQVVVETEHVDELRRMVE